MTATLTGKLADIFGKRRLLVATMGVVVLGSLIAAFARTSGFSWWAACCKDQRCRFPSSSRR